MFGYAIPNYFVSGKNTTLLTYFVMFPIVLCLHETTYGWGNIFSRVYIGVEGLLYMFLVHPAACLISFLIYEQTTRHTKHGSSHLNDSFYTLSISQIYHLCRGIYQFLFLPRQIYMWVLCTSYDVMYISIMIMFSSIYVPFARGSENWKVP